MVDDARQKGSIPVIADNRRDAIRAAREANLEATNAPAKRMTVRDLIVLLGTMPLDAEVVYDCYSDARFMSPDDISMTPFFVPKLSDDWLVQVRDNETDSPVKLYCHFPGN